MSSKQWIAEITEVDSDIWSTDVECDTKEEVIKEGMKLAKEEGYTSFRIGEKIPVGIPALDVDAILDNVYDQIYDEVGEVAEGLWDGVTEEQQKELEEKLNEVFVEWVTKYKHDPCCYTVTNDEIIEVK